MKMYVRTPHIEHVQLATASASTSIQPFWNLIGQWLDSVTHLDTRYLILRTPAGNLEHQPLIFSFSFSNFKFASYGHLQQKSIQYVFKNSVYLVDILAGVFLVSSFCVMPESSYPSNAKKQHPIGNLVLELLQCSLVLELLQCTQYQRVNIGFIQNSCAGGDSC